LTSEITLFWTDKPVFGRPVWKGFQNPGLVCDRWWHGWLF